MKIINFLFIFIIILILTFFNIYLYLEQCPNEDKNYKRSSPLLVRSTLNATNSRIFFITPTYYRPVQQAELTRLSHTLLLVPNIHWILVEDSTHKSKFLTKFLKKIFNQRIFNDFDYTHLNAETPGTFKTSQNDPNWLKPRGVWQRNEALRWLRENYTATTRIKSKNGVVYFGDDDNTYDLKLFDEMRDTRKVSVFPVGLVGGLLVEKPLVSNKTKHVIGFNSIWKPKRKYPIDMSGFAINLNLLIEKNRDANFSPYVPRGYQETHLLTQLIQSIDELEPKADLCTKILVWHTRTELPKLRKKI